jgi:hypothetical protein
LGGEVAAAAFSSATAEELLWCSMVNLGLLLILLLLLLLGRGLFVKVESFA